MMHRNVTRLFTGALLTVLSAGCLFISAGCTPKDEAAEAYTSPAPPKAGAPAAGMPAGGGAAPPPAAGGVAPMEAPK